MSDRLSRFFNAVWYRGLPLAWLLWPAGWLYCGLAGLRRRLYAAGVLRTVRLAVPVVVVGNISAGGTGKTPGVIWLARTLVSRGYRVGIVSRGYRGRATDWPQPVGPDSDPDRCGDEPVLIAQRTACPVAVGPDRVAAAEWLLRRHPLDVIVADDGLQHYRLGRDFEIAVVDGARGLGNGLCLPAGPLREPEARLLSVDAVVVNSGPWGGDGVFRAELVPSRVYRLTDGHEARLDEFAGRRVHALAGIAHPRRFFDLLERAGLRVDAWPLPDHARIAAVDLRFGDDQPVMITEKDAVKCRRLADESVWCVTVDLRFQDNGAERLARMVVDRLSSGG